MGNLEDFPDDLIVHYSDHSTDDSDDGDDELPRGNSQVERCIEQLRDVLGDAVPRRELVRVTLAADCDPNRALNFYFAWQKSAWHLTNFVFLMPFENQPRIGGQWLFYCQLRPEPLYLHTPNKRFFWGVRLLIVNEHSIFWQGWVGILR